MERDRWIGDLKRNRQENPIFSATDISAYFCIPQDPYSISRNKTEPTRNYLIGNLSVVSISTHRDKFPVTALGNVGVRGFTRGHRIIGGTLVFQTFDRHAFYDFFIDLEVTRTGASREDLTSAISTILADEMPPFDIIISMVNEDGAVAFTSILGVVIQDEGKAMSVDNISISETYSYMAAAYLPMQPTLPKPHKPTSSDASYHNNIFNKYRLSLNPKYQSSFNIGIGYSGSGSSLNLNTGYSGSGMDLSLSGASLSSLGGGSATYVINGNSLPNPNSTLP